MRRVRRRRRLLTVALAGGSTLVALVVVGALLGGASGVWLGLAIGALAVFGAVSVRRLAARRGATAWDWQLQRHRLLANPSERVRASDDRSGRDRSRPWEA